MGKTYANALVLKKDGDTALLRTQQEGSEQEVTCRRSEESPQEFLKMFPFQGVVQIFQGQDENSPEEEDDDVISSWIAVEVLSNDGGSALLKLPGGKQIRFNRVNDSQSDFVKAWPPGDTVKFQM